MEKIIRYTSAGKKVVVLEKFQSNEYLVQEICLNSKGEEVISDGKFIERGGLFSEPVESWQARREREIARSIENLKFKEKEAESKLRDYEKKIKGYADLLKRSNFLERKLPSFDWDKFIDIATGNIKWVVRRGYYWYKPVLANSRDGSFSFDGRDYDGLKALQIVSKSTGHGWDREFVFGMNYYRDGSGSYEEFIFFKTDKELKTYLLSELAEQHSKNNVSIGHLIELKKFIRIPRQISKEIISERKSQIKEFQKKEKEERKEKHKLFLREIKQLTKSSKK